MSAPAIGIGLDGNNDVPIAQIPGLVLPAMLDTILMVGIVMAIVVVVGIPLGSIIHNLAEGGLFESPALYRVLNWVVSAGRSLPFLVLMAAIVPFTQWLTGTVIGIPAAVVPMSIAGSAFFTRIVENSLRSVPSTLASVAKASGASRLQIIISAQLSEALPSLIGGFTINTIAMIDYSAIAGSIGAGGIGYVAVTYGYQRFDHTVMLVTIVVLIATVALVQFLGDQLVRLTTPERRLRESRRTLGARPGGAQPGRAHPASAHLLGSAK